MRQENCLPVTLTDLLAEVEAFQPTEQDLAELNQRVAEAERSLRLKLSPSE